MKFRQTLLEEYRKLKIAEAVDFEKFNRYAITHHSTALEGSYIQALVESRKQESTTPIVDFMFGQYSKQLQQEITAYKKGIGLQMKPKGKRGLSLFF